MRNYLAGDECGDSLILYPYNDDVPINLIMASLPTLHIMMTFTKFIEQTFDMCRGLGKSVNACHRMHVEEFNEQEQIFGLFALLLKLIEGRFAINFMLEGVCK